MSKFEFDIASFGRLLSIMAGATGKSMGAVLRNESGLFAKQAAAILPPRTMGQGKRRVKSDIGRVFISPSKIFAAMKKVDEPAAKIFWKHVTNRQLAAAHDVLRRIPFPFQHATIALTPDPAIHQRARDRRGRVSQRRKPMDIIADAKALRAFIERKQSHVGLTKSPWAKVANALGKPCPNWMVGQQSGFILQDATKSVLTPEITVGSKIPWADNDHGQDALNKALASRVENIRKNAEKILMREIARANRFKG